MGLNGRETSIMILQQGHVRVCSRQILVITHDSTTNIVTKSNVHGQYLNTRHRLVHEAGDVDCLEGRPRMNPWSWHAHELQSFIADIIYAYQHLRRTVPKPL